MYSLISIPYNAQYIQYTTYMCHVSADGGYRVYCIYMNTSIDVVWVIFFYYHYFYSVQIHFNGQSRRRRRLKHYNIILYYTVRRLDMLLFVYILYTYCYYRHCILWDSIVLNVTRVSLRSDIVSVPILLQLIYCADDAEATSCPVVIVYPKTFSNFRVNIYIPTLYCNTRNFVLNLTR